MRHRNLTGPAKWLLMALTWGGIGTAIFYVFRLHIAGQVMVDIGFWALLLAAFLPAVFLVYPATKRAPVDRVPWYDFCLAGVSALGPAFVFIFALQILTSMWPLQPPAPLIVLGLVTWVLILECVRRTTGWILAALLGLFSIYPLFASHLPSVLFAKSYSLDRLVGYYFLTSQGILSGPTQILGGILIGYVLFGVIMEVTGAAQFLLDIAQGLLGRLRGGPALVAVVASSFMASLSGSPVANVMAVGTITIPAMKKLGYKPHVAAAIESVASTGGTLMPPVMGATAFVMAALLEISYASVAIAAAIPMIIYYVGLFAQVYFYAQREALPAIPASEIPSMAGALKRGWFYLGGIVVLIYFMFWMSVEAWAPYYASAFLVACSLMRKETRPNLATISRLTISMGRLLAQLAPILAGVGLVLGAFSLTGIGQSIGMELGALAHGNLYLLLVIGAITGIILGMGLPMIGVFIFSVVIFAPPLISAGVSPIAANLFFLYWGMISFFTPPVCISVFVAAAIAGSEVWQTGRWSVRLGIVAFIIPFAFVLNPLLMAQGSPMAITLGIVTAMAGAALIAASAEAYLVWIGRLAAAPRILLFCSGILLLFTVWLAQVAGAALAVMVIMALFARKASIKEEAKEVEV